VTIACGRVHSVVRTVAETGGDTAPYDRYLERTLGLGESVSRYIGMRRCPLAHSLPTGCPVSTKRPWHGGAMGAATVLMSRWRYGTQGLSRDMVRYLGCVSVR
jgi:hypothetical protein